MAGGGEDFSKEPSILNRGANIYSDINIVCIHSVAVIHGLSSIETHEFIRIPPLKYPKC